MLLKDLIKDIFLKPLPQSFQSIDVKSIHCDSRQKQEGGLFVALDGFKVKGEDFIKDAIAQGAVVIAKKTSRRELTNYTIPEHICLLDIDDPKQFLRQITLRFFDNPSSKVKTIGVTGTNGKTTITYLLESILSADTKPSAVIGTVNYRIAGKVFPSKNTTPGFLELQSHLNTLVEFKIPYCVMEVSSHALEQGRVDEIDFVSAVFTNLTQDHLDYHKNMENYFRAKALLFERLNSDALAVINQDDPYGQNLVKITKSKVLTYGLKNADVKATAIHSSLSGTLIKASFDKKEISLKTRFIGLHNVYNILAASACAYGLGIGLDKIQQGVERLTCVPGRLEPIDEGQDFFIFIDYAHTPDGLLNVLNALRNISRNKIILIFGCGGDRDHGKRPLMGQVACQKADYSIITSDNPRSEDPMSIIEEIKPGFTRSNFEVIADRRQAIAQGLAMAKHGEIVLIAGKGHEDYQILKDKTIPFNEIEIVKECLQSLKK